MRFALAVIGIVVLALVAGEILMRPSSSDRLALLAIFSGIALMTVVLGIFLRLLTGRMKSLHRAVLLVAVATVSVALVAVAFSAQLMFLNTHDLRVVLVALGLGVGLGIVLAAAISRPLAADLERLASTAREVGGGDLTVRTGVTRPDELGEAARALDTMIGRLQEAERERADSEESRRRFLTSVSHDLRTPLTALQAAVEALEDGVVTDTPRYLQAMQVDLAVLRRLVDDVFLLARLEAGDLPHDPTTVDVAELADEAIEIMGPVAAQRGVGLRLEASGSALVEGGSHELGRAIRNMVDNALRYAPASTDVVIIVNRQNGDVALTVVDEGPGFPEDFVEAAFDRFSKADASRSEGGAGLGLAITKAVVDAHHGRVWIERGDGGRVAVRLPSAI